MKTFLTTIQKALNHHLKEVRYISRNYGQLSMEQAPVQFPCVLIDIDRVEYESISHGGQTATAEVSFLVADSTLEPVQGMHLQTIDIIETLHQVLQGLSGTTFQPLNRISLTRTIAEKGIDAYTITYSTAWIEKKAEN